MFDSQISKIIGSDVNYSTTVVDKMISRKKNINYQEAKKLLFNHGMNCLHYDDTAVINGRMIKLKVHKPIVETILKNLCDKSNNARREYVFYS